MNPQRILLDHVIHGKVYCNSVYAIDAAGDGGASHEYNIVVDETRQYRVSFQNGPISADNPPTGIHNEDLVSIVIDRLRGFQSGKFACRENAEAMTHFEEGLMWLQKRTRDRMARGVEGTHEK